MILRKTQVVPEKPANLRKNGCDDVTLFKRFLEGDDSAFMELFHRHTPRLYVYCLKIVGDQEIANDILQDVWERLARYRAHGKDAPNSPLGLLIRITRNLCLNHKRDRRPRLSLEEVAEWKEQRTYQNDMTEMEEAVIVALEHLPESQRELLILHAYSGYSYEEIAEMLDESVGAVRTRAWRARMKLGRMIAALIDMAEESDEEKKEWTSRNSAEYRSTMNITGDRTL